MKRFVFGALLVVLLLLGRSPEAQATVIASGTSNGLSASASFTISGTSLTIMLTNTDTAPEAASSGWVPAEVLTGLFFNLGGSAFTPTSATIAAGSVAQAASCSPGPCATATNVGGEWSYAFGGVVDPDIIGANQGISSGAYLNARAFGGNFSGPNLDNTNPRNVVHFGLVPETFTDNSGNSAVDGRPLIKGTATFVLNIPTGLSESMISNVYFTYGTSLNDPSHSGSVSGGSGGDRVVPEPTLLAIVGAGLAAVGYRLRRRA